MRRKRRVIAGLTVACGALLLWSVWPREQLLMSQAKRITDAKYWRRDPDAYFWLSDHEVMLFRTWPRNPYAAQRLDVTTGQETPFTVLNTRLDRERKATGGLPFQQTLSPDGKWLLQRLALPKKAATYFFAAAVDGSKEIRYPEMSGSWPPMTLTGTEHHPVWWHDSSRWVDVQTVNRSDLWAAVLHPLGAEQPLKIPLIEAWKQGGAKDGNSILGFQKDGRLVTGSALTMMQTKGQADFASYRLDPKADPEPYSVLVPGFFEDYQALLSPQGDRLMWIVRSTGRQTSVGLLERFYRALGLRSSRPQVGLWVSDTRGNGLLEIGHVNLPPGTNISAQDQPTLVRWLPNGRSASFIYHDILYTFPVE